jgi:hypothetical protein
MIKFLWLKQAGEIGRAEKEIPGRPGKSEGSFGKEGGAFGGQ